MRRGRRNRTLSSGSSKRASTLDQTNQLQTTRQSELASTVFHVRALLRSLQSSLTESLRTGPDVLPSTVHQVRRQNSYSGGLSALRFVKTLTYQRVTDPEASRPLAEAVAEISAAEGLPAHGATATRRLARL
jgi:histidinol dehydrogenase